MESIDNSLILWLNSLSGQYHLLDNIVIVIAGDYLLPVYASLTLLWMWFSQESKTTRVKYQISALVAIGSVGLSNFSVRAIMGIFHRARPFEDLPIEVLLYAPTDPSFPSNPVSVLAGIATAAVIANRKLGAILFGMTFTMAIGRVYAGVAYPSDVSAGVIVGIGCAFIAFGISKLAYPTVQLLLRAARVFCLA